MDLKEAWTRSIELMDKHGLIAKGWKFDMNMRRSSLGLCSHGRNTIELSAPLTKANTWDRMKRTVLHEIAHALIGPGHGHDMIWKSICLAIGGDGLVKADDITLPQYKWNAICPEHGHVGGWSRKPREQYHCTRCHNRVRIEAGL